MPLRPHSRYVHDTSLSSQKNKGLYEFGKKQAAESLKRYHMLCAAIKGEYEIISVPPDFSRAQLFPRAGITFNRYRAYPLEDVLGVKLHPRDDGTLLPADLEMYAREMRSNWQCREGGILRCVGNCDRAFWNMILNYHSVAATAGIKAWDKLFANLKRNNFDMGLVPCPVCHIRHYIKLKSHALLIDCLISILLESPDAVIPTVHFSMTRKSVSATARRSSREDAFSSESPI